MPEADLVAAMSPDALSIKTGVILIDIMRRKAAENNVVFDTDMWTPRKIDMGILWTYGRD